MTRSVWAQDGPTHQPIEQLATLRSTPNLITLRPADANEVVEAWRVVCRVLLPLRNQSVSAPFLPRLQRQSRASLAAPLRFALLREGPRAFLDIVRGEQFFQRGELLGERLFQRQIQAL